MNQILHIFAKDVRHLRYEILLLLVFVGTEIWLGPAQWGHSWRLGSTINEAMQTVSALSLPLMQILWALLIARLVHSESLVGDRQFWITRPYCWKKLLAAKLTFLVIFIYLPFLLMQCALLAEAGFSPLPWIPRILMTLLLISAVVILPLVAIASITPNFARMAFITVLVLFCFIFVAAVTQSTLTRINSHTTPAPLVWYLIELVLFMACALTVVLQYVRRRTLVSRLLLIGAAAICSAISLTDIDHMVMNRTYPRASDQGPESLQISITGNHADTQVRPWMGEPKNLVGIPVRLAGIPDSSKITIDQAKATFFAPNGVHWTSDWEPRGDSSGSERDVSVIIPMPHELYSQVKDMSLSVRLNLAITVMKADRTTEIQLPPWSAQEASVPGFGICTDDVTFLGCRFAFQPPLTLVNAHWYYNGDCMLSQTNPGMPGSGWTGALSDSAPSLDFFPITHSWVASNNMQQTPKGEELRVLCPGTPITFTTYELVRRMQTEVTVQDFHL